MKNATQHIKHIAALLTLAAASTSVFAQSADYRRGYDDGYAAAQRDAREDGGRGDRGRDRSYLQILEAAYYGPDGSCNARRGVRAEVEENRGVVAASDKLCGDPDVGARKTLRIVYRCGDDAPQRLVVRQYEKARLSCRRG